MTAGLAGSGFVDVARNARKVVFCGTFDTKGAVLATGDGHRCIDRHGDLRKLVRNVDQITFSGPQALRQGQEVVYVTERAVFRLTARDVTLVIMTLAASILTFGTGRTNVLFGFLHLVIFGTFLFLAFVP
jgi:acyl CoA:acetate/3-ketoacid CoA transferase